MLAIQLETVPFEPLSVLAEWQAQLALLPGGMPAAESQFIGRVRGCDATGEPLEALELEHYPGMTEACIASLSAAAAGRHGATAVLVRHRIGLVLPGDAIVLVAVAADRRGPAQRCCQELLEALKHEAPFWKREWSQGVGSWITGNTPL
ncbi:molybdenum cofactor biosynthesis protein MoaE [Cyanobium sp. BA5m-21]|nr:molybdenum cofactor biosynthesis protein MoaE [Cyanobium sp. BA5m-10]MCP9905937.1 molybdenum cofactor biosynthesis protein MoaE [Cyanobium sp. BA5m-21]MCP9913432.1 molybdenum cofactor biosynthesis protein MoaE [Cyanobium sp. BA20m-14]